MEEGYARKGETSLAFRSVGDGPVDLLVGAGLACHLDLFKGDPGCDAWVRRLARMGRVVLFDKPGTGLSDPLAAMPTVDERVSDHLAVMDAVGSRRTILVGISEAVAPALLLAAQHPDRIEAVVAISGSPRLCCAEDYFPELDWYVEGYVWKVLWHSAEHWGDGTFMRAVSPNIRSSPVMSRMAPALERACAPPSMARLIIRSARDYDVRAALDAVRVPVLVLNRTEEWVPQVLAEDLAERIHGSQLAILPGDEHLPMFRGGDILSVVERFVGGGVASGRRPDRVLKTILFTDVVDSTDTAASLGDEQWRSTLAHLHEQADAVVGRLDGMVVKSTGDGVLATFDSPALALDAAARLHDSAESLGVSVRAGLHTGECELVGDDVAGIAVHIAARVAARATAGETLATATVRDLVLGSDTRWVDRGEHELKGVPGRWRIVAVDRSDRPLTPAVELPPPTGRRLSDRLFIGLIGRAPRLTRALIRAAYRNQDGRSKSGAAAPTS